MGNVIVEYILVTAFVALATIAIFRTFRSQIGEAYEKAGEALVQGVNDGLGGNPQADE